MNSYLPFFAQALISLSVFLLGMQVFSFVRFVWRKLRPNEVDAKRFWTFVDKREVSGGFAALLRKETLEKYVPSAGLPLEFTAARFVKLKLVLLPIAILLGVFAWLVGIAWYVTLAFIILVIIGPDIYIRRKSESRALFAAKTLPQILDLLRMQSNIGLNLEHSIENVAKGRSDLWKKELGTVVFEMNAGLALVQTLDRLSIRFATEELKRFSLAMKQAKVLGASLSQTLAIQSEALRTRRRQRAEEQARVAAVKIAFPLVIFIFPALLIVYIAPAILRVLQLA